MGQCTALKFVRIMAKVPTCVCRLMELGFTKLVNDLDVKEATRQGLMSLEAKEFTSTVIQKHLEDFGLDPEFSTHSAIRGLSGAFRTPGLGIKLENRMSPLGCRAPLSS
jgi:hypothetical protein